MEGKIKNLTNNTKFILQDESGMGMTEYIIIIAFVSIGILLFFAAVVREGFATYFNEIANVVKLPIP